MRMSLGQDYTVTATIIGCTDMDGNPITGGDCPALPAGDATTLESSGGSIITTGNTGTGLIPGFNGVGLGLNNLPNPQLFESLIWLALLVGGIFLYTEVRR